MNEYVACLDYLRLQVWDVYEDQNALDLIKDMENAKAMSKKLLVATLKAGNYTSLISEKHRLC